VKDSGSKVVVEKVFPSGLSLLYAGTKNLFDFLLQSLVFLQKLEFCCDFDFRSNLFLRYSCFFLLLKGWRLLLLL
jgi:hypothetical protein